jgi:diketogulonate reductase-like aldo/keto reductase
MTALTTIPTIDLPSGEAIPVLGQGTWGFGERRSHRAAEAAALLEGVELGMTLVDTAEMYGEGGAEELIGEVLGGTRRDEVFLVTKVLPSHATREGTAAACERSLRRLRTDHIDLYLLHWRGPVRLEETVAAFVELQRVGAIRHWGVSNFDTADLAELLEVPGGNGVEVDQVLYNLTRRGIEWDLLPSCQRAGLPIMAYSPFERGRMLAHPGLQALAVRHGVTPAQIALAWVLRQPLVNAIPKASTPEHVRENRAALEIRLTAEDVAELDAMFPPPTGPMPLEVI